MKKLVIAKDQELQDQLDKEIQTKVVSDLHGLIITSVDFFFKKAGWALGNEGGSKEVTPVST